MCAFDFTQSHQTRPRLSGTLPGRRHLLGIISSPSERSGACSTSEAFTILSGPSQLRLAVARLYEIIAQCHTLPWLSPCHRLEYPHAFCDCSPFRVLRTSKTRNCTNHTVDSSMPAHLEDAGLRFRQWSTSAAVGRRRAIPTLALTPDSRSHSIGDLFVPLPAPVFWPTSFPATLAVDLTIPLSSLYPTLVSGFLIPGGE